MKKSIVFFLFAMMISNILQAQLPISAGLKIGFNSSKMPTEINNVSDIKDQSRNGFLAGAFVRIKLTKFYIQPEVYYTKKGGDFQYSNTSNIFTQQSSFSTVDVPLLVGIKLIDLKVFNFRLMAGPVASFITDKNVSYQVNGVNLPAVPSPTLNFKNTIWGLQAGAGIDVLNFTLDIRYEWGINNFSDYADMTTKSKILHVGLGMKFF
jgi:hypothetical protein